MVRSQTATSGSGLFSVWYKLTRTPTLLSCTREGGRVEGRMRVRGTSTSRRTSRAGGTGARWREGEEIGVVAIGVVEIGDAVPIVLQGLH